MQLLISAQEEEEAVRPAVLLPVVDDSQPDRDKKPGALLLPKPDIQPAADNVMVGGFISTCITSRVVPGPTTNL